MSIKPIETRYKGYRFRSRLEARWAVFLDAIGTPWEYEKEGYIVDGRPYLPDFWLPALNSWLEVKGVLYEDEAELCAKFVESMGARVLIGVGLPDWWEDVAQQADLYEIDKIGLFDADTQQRRSWAVCKHCRTVFASYLGELTCSCIAEDKYNQKRLDSAFAAARGARFEHGESPRL